MIITFYITLILILGSVIILLIFSIYNRNITHKVKMESLYYTLSVAEGNYEKNSQKTVFDSQLKTLIKEMKSKLNNDIFELQVDIFKKISNN